MEIALYTFMAKASREEVQLSKCHLRLFSMLAVALSSTDSLYRTVIPRPSRNLAAALGKNTLTGLVPLENTSYTFLHLLGLSEDKQCYII